MMYLYHRVAFVRHMVPNLVKLNTTNVPLNPLVSVSKLETDVLQNRTKQLKKLPTVISQEDMGDLKHQSLQKASLPLN